MRYNPEKYFNAGVLLMNLSRIRQEYDLAKEAFCFFKRYSYLCDLADNDFLCALFNRDVLSIDGRFNRVDKSGDSAIDNAILHYACSKPWQSAQISLFNAFFWEVFYESEWGDSPIDAPVLGYSNNYLRWADLKLSLPRLSMRLRIKYIALYILRILGYIPPLLKEICLRCFECLASLLRVNFRGQSGL
ncbi:hypothetical protein AGMMS50276_30810 [Synergistales bacterium]|nr:hypothetical protein AGMMS50276_30810 [Synergistales bacterium]